jgi:hypothetical protein
MRRRTFSSVEADEIRVLLGELTAERRAEQRIAAARLRRMGFFEVDEAPPRLTPSDFDALVDAGDLTVDVDGSSARAHIRQHASGNIFRVAVGVTGEPVDPTWSAFDERYQWFGKAPQNITSGAHLFVLAVDRWKSAVVGLYETVTAGADRLPDSPDPERWPWAVGVRPLAAIPPSEAVRVEGQTGPQSGLPERVYDESAWPKLYAAVAASPPPPGPKTLEQRVQELEWQDVADDVLAAVDSLGSRARRTETIERAVDIGEWTQEELDARAWYTGTGRESHIENIVAKALQNEHVLTQRLDRQKGSGPYVPRGRAAAAAQFGARYRPATQAAVTEPDDIVHRVDLSALDAATARHMSMQDELANNLRERGIEPRSPGSWEPQYDLAFEHDGQRYVVEVKSGSPVSSQQVRLGVGQVLEYCYLMRRLGQQLHPVLMLEGDPPNPWGVLASDLGIAVIRVAELVASLDRLLAQRS